MAAGRFRRQIAMPQTRAKTRKSQCQQRTDATSAATKRFFSKTLAESDPEVAAAIAKEFDRQQHEIELIASENIVSRAVLEAAGSVLTNKYAEGYPGRRYYGGCQYVDIAEELAIDRAKKLFGCELRQRPAELGQPGQPGRVQRAPAAGRHHPRPVSLAAGGHLTHGAPVNQSGKWFKAVPLHGVDRETHLIDMDEVRKLAQREQAQAHHRRRLGLSAQDRLRRLPRDRR